MNYQVQYYLVEVDCNRQLNRLSIDIICVAQVSLVVDIVEIWYLARDSQDANAVEPKTNLSICLQTANTLFFKFIVVQKEFFDS